MMTLSELHMVEGVNEELYNFFAPMFTVFSGGAINVNSASAVMLKTLDSRFTDEEVNAAYLLKKKSL